MFILHACLSSAPGIWPRLILTILVSVISCPSQWCYALGGLFLALGMQLTENKKAVV